MHNVTHEFKGDKLIIVVDASPDAINAAPPSSSGKTRLVATTSGAMAVATPSGKVLSFALNVMTK